MTQLRLDPESWDVTFDETGDLQEVGGAEETTQASKFRLQILRGELFEDLRPGIPWLTDMVDPRISIDAKKQILRAAILASPGVVTLDSLVVGFDNVTGQASCTFTGTAQDGGTFGASVTLA